MFRTSEDLATLDSFTKESKEVLNNTHKKAKSCTRSSGWNVSVASMQKILCTTMKTMSFESFEQQILAPSCSFSKLKKEEDANCNR